MLGLCKGIEVLYDAWDFLFSSCLIHMRNTLLDTNLLDLFVSVRNFLLKVKNDPNREISNIHRLISGVLQPIWKSTLEEAIFFCLFQPDLLQLFKLD